MEKGFKTLELIGDLDDKYIYEASKPWKKQHRFFHIQRSWKTAVAGIILLIMVGCTLRYQEDVKAALQRVTSWIGQALGIKNRFLYKCCRKKHFKRWNHHNIK